MGLIQHRIGRYQDALDCFNKSLETEPNNIENLNNAALCLSNMGRFKEAIALLKKAIGLDKDAAYLFSNLGLQYRQADDLESAILMFKIALELKEDAKAWTMLGGCYGDLRNFSEAKECFEKAVTLDWDFAPPHIDLAHLYHLTGRTREGWIEYEWRDKVYDQLKIWDMIYDPVKKWSGQPGKTIMVHTEQGSGDAIHFARYLPFIEGKVIVHCSEALAPLFKQYETYTVDPVTIPIRMAQDPNFKLPQHDWHCSIMSLPYLLYEPPAPTSYLTVDKKISLSDYSDYFKVGIAWAGNPQHPNDSYRSCYLKWFEPISQIKGVKLFSLVKDTRPRAYRFNPTPIDLAEGAENMRVVDMAPMMETFEDTAAIINELDLVISVDTVVLHLAGALGKPVWGLLPWNNDWRWGLDSDKTIWYESMVLFRQSKKGDWKPVFEQITNKLKEKIYGRGSC
jgi:hypothetical protein